MTYLTTALAPEEVVTEPGCRWLATARWGFHEVVRRYSDFATVSVSVVARPAPSGGPPELSVVLGGVADRPVLVDRDLLEPALADAGRPRPRT